MYNSLLQSMKENEDGHFHFERVSRQASAKLFHISGLSSDFLKYQCVYERYALCRMNGVLTLKYHETQPLPGIVEEFTIRKRESHKYHPILISFSFLFSS